MSQAIACIDCTSSTSLGSENAETPAIKFYKSVMSAFQGNTDTFAFQKQHSLQLLYNTYREYSDENWDGYGAKPVSLVSLSEARRFIECLPFNIPAPSDISADPDGHITMEWRNPRGLIFAMSFSGTSEVYYAGLLGANKPRGILYFVDSIQKDVIEKILSVGA